MKTIITGGACIALICALHSSFAADSSPVVGIWQTEASSTGGRAHVQIAPCGEKMCGTIVAAVDKDGVAIADYAHIGKEMIAGMVEKAPGSYAGGTIWAPDKNKTYKSKMKLSAKGNLVVKGCVAFVCRSQTWTLVK